jgi:hypothetical protein
MEPALGLMFAVAEEEASPVLKPESRE